MSLKICTPLLLALALTASAADAKKPKTPKPTRVENMDFGPFISASIGKIERPADAAEKDKSSDKNEPAKPYATKDGLVMKGIVVKLAQHRGGLDSTPRDIATACFDTDLLRYAAWWTGGFVDFSQTNTGQYKGDLPAAGKGEVRFGLRPTPGVALNGKFQDNRAGGVGPLPYDSARYNGLYLHGNEVIFSYTLGGVEILDMPGMSGAGFTRTLRVGPSKQPLNFALFEKGDKVSAVLSVNPHTTLGKIGSQECVTVKPREEPTAFIVTIVSEDSGKLQPQTPENLAEKITGGPPRWKETLESSVTAGADTAPYVLDNFELPDKNPWHSWMRPSGFDFFADGSRAAVCTLSGDVWLVSGLNDKKLTWKRFATGLYEPLGLKIVDGQIYVLGRDQITRLHDLNHDDEADFYENFCSKWNVSPSYHAFSFDLWTDKEGNFYYANTLNQVDLSLPGHGVIFKISKDGRKIEEVASGLRAPNGMAVGPNGEIVVGDNQGFWTPSSKINWVTRGAFLGFPGDPRKNTGPVKYKVPETFDPPLCWIPYASDTSTGGQAFITSDKWGPFTGQLISLSYGKCSMLIVTTENADGVMQGGSMRLPLTFPSGPMRARFNERDGQLYVCGLKGWQTTAAKDGCFNRVRYTGLPVNLPLSVKTHPRGIDITFTGPLDEALAKDLTSYALEEWGYSWTAAYGSADYKVSNPKEKGRDTVDVEYVNLSADKKTVSLALKKIHPVMQLGIKMKLHAANGDVINTELDYTINKVGK